MVSRQTPDFNGAGQVFAGKFTRPRHHLAKRLAVAVTKHLQDGGIANRRQLEPLLAYIDEIIAHASAKAKASSRNATALWSARQSGLGRRGQDVPLRQQGSFQPCRRRTGKGAPNDDPPQEITAGTER